MKNVLIVKHTQSEKYWNPTTPATHKTGHMYYRSPIESDDRCGNCDGAKCEFCTDIIEDCKFEASIPYDEYAEMAIKEGVPKDIAYDIATSDSYNHAEGYRIIYPTFAQLKDHCPEFAAKLETVDAEVFEYIKASNQVHFAHFKHGNPAFIKIAICDLRDFVINNLIKAEYGDKSEEFYHYKNQLNMFLYKSSNYIHATYLEDVPNNIIERMIDRYLADNKGGIK